MGLGRRRLSARGVSHSQANARASGATAVLAAAGVVASLDEAIAGCALAIGLSARPREFAGRVLPIREAAAAAIGHVAHGDVALVFGNEMSGLSNEELARCGIVATIPTNPEFASLNLAAAVQVAAYELRVAAGDGGVWSAPRFAPATTDEIAALELHARTTLTDMRFLHPQLPRRLMPRLRRLFGRAALGEGGGQHPARHPRAHRRYPARGEPEERSCRQLRRAASCGGVAGWTGSLHWAGLLTAALRRAVVGMAALAAHQHALATLAGVARTHPFHRKFRLFAEGRLPLGYHAGRYVIY